MHMRTPEGSLLNMNDCWIIDRQQLQAIKQQVGAVDVLATQFSVSAWDGNADEVERLRQGARAMLDKALIQCEVFAPRWVLPFASFIWFCHEENAYMNQAFLGIDEVEMAFRTKSTPVMMYPGDSWTVGQPHDNAAALARWRADQQALPQRPRVKSATRRPRRADRIQPQLLPGADRRVGPVAGEGPLGGTGIPARGADGRCPIGCAIWSACGRRPPPSG